MTCPNSSFVVKAISIERASRSSWAPPLYTSSRPCACKRGRRVAHIHACTCAAGLQACTPDIAVSAAGTHGVALVSRLAGRAHRDSGAALRDAGGHAENTPQQRCFLSEPGQMPGGAHQPLHLQLPPCTRSKTACYPHSRTVHASTPPATPAHAQCAHSHNCLLPLLMRSACTHTARAIASTPGRASPPAARSCSCHCCDRPT